MENEFIIYKIDALIIYIYIYIFDKCFILLNGKISSLEEFYLIIIAFI